MTYSLDFRKAVIATLDRTGNVAATARQYRITRLTIYQWQTLRKNTGFLNKQPLKRSFKKIDPKVLAQRVADQPNARLKDHAEYFGACFQSVSTAIKKLKITRKKK